MQQGFGSNLIRIPRLRLIVCAAEDKFGLVELG